MINFTNISKRLSIALTTTVTLAGALSVSSCQDYDNGFDSETLKRSEYNKAFEAQFGTPAPNHQWGFDIAQAMMMNNTSSNTRGLLTGNATQGLVYKQDMNVEIPHTYDPFYDYVPVCSVYGRPKDITKKEHEEVFAWFSAHRVNWANTPTNTEVNADGSRLTRDGGSKIIAHLIDEADTSESGPMGSLAKPANNNILGDYTDDNELYFFNGWIQHVAYDPEYDEIGKDGTSKYNGLNMNFLAFRHIDQVDDFIHLNDYNASKGYGWGRQPSTDGTSDAGPEASNGQNAILVVDAKFDVVTYGCSADGSKPHNKYYIVHLKGDDYDGYYLGMDLEGFDPTAAADNNANVEADGICNDWIIKIGDAGAKPFNPARIMCEDLGARDFDYNDIVFDVQYSADEATITVRAAGGTIPIGIYYGDTQLKKGDEGEIHTLFGSAITTPVNVNGGDDNKASIVFKLKFSTSNTTDTYYDGQNNVKYAYYSQDKFNMQNIQVKVQHTTNAEWVTLANIDGQSPLKICVPQSVKWTQECKGIETAYSGFRRWVGNPTKWFWDTTIDGNTINSGLLYNN